MFDDDAGDERDPTANPLPPEDRLWRHPSEVGAARRAGLAAAAGPPSSSSGASRPMLAVAVVAGLTGAAVAITALALTGSLSPRVVERHTPVSSAQLAGATTVPGQKTVRALVTGAAAAVARVEVADAAGASHVGSAVVLLADGALLTSAALVRDVEQADVLLPDGRRVAGTVAGRDPDVGLAVLRVPADGLQPLSDSVRAPKPGDLAVTMAGRSAPSAELTVTSGVVSTIDRGYRHGSVALFGLIETDRAVPEAADGGPLIGPDGGVSGIALHLPDAGGMGHAVPIDVAARIGLDLLEHGRPRAAWLGVHAIDLDDEAASDLGVDGGAQLETVTAASPGAVAGLQPEDVIVRLGPNAVRDMADLKGSLKAHRPGETVTVGVLRDGQETRLTATLGEKPTP